MFDDSRFMMIETYFGGRDFHWVAIDTLDDNGPRAATAGIGLERRRLKKAVVVLAFMFAIGWYFYPNLALLACMAFLYFLWAWTMYHTHSIIYRVLLNPENNLWYVIANVNLERKVGTWVPSSRGFASQLEATIEARRLREKYDC